jgi:hypothetical protein
MTAPSLGVGLKGWRILLGTGKLVIWVNVKFIEDAAAEEEEDDIADGPADAVPVNDTSQWDQGRDVCLHWSPEQSVRVGRHSPPKRGTPTMHAGSCMRHRVRNMHKGTARQITSRSTQEATRTNQRALVQVRRTP